jgi:hypothetical protein
MGGGKRSQKDRPLQGRSMPSPAKAITVERVRPLPCSPPYAGYLHNVHAGHWFDHARVVHSVDDIPLVRQEASVGAGTFQSRAHDQRCKGRPLGRPDRAWRERRRKARRIGRPAINPKLRQEIADRMATGSSAYRAAKDRGLDRKSVAKYAATILVGQQEWGIPRCQR